MINVPCRCGRVLMLPDDYAGKTGRCKACGERLLVPFLREGGGAAVIRAEEGPIKLEDVAEPILYVASDPPKPDADLDWILPPDPPRAVVGAARPVPIYEPGLAPSCSVASVQAVCWILVVGGILRFLLSGRSDSLLLSIAAGIVLLATRPSPFVKHAPVGDVLMMIKAILCLVAAFAVVLGFIALING